MKILSLDLSTKSSGWAVFENFKLYRFNKKNSNNDKWYKRNTWKIWNK